MLRTNSKGEYFRQQRQSEVDLENQVLLGKINSIRGSPKKPKGLNPMEYSHSLNRITRQKSLRTIK